MCHVNSFSDVFCLLSRKLVFLQYSELGQPSVSRFWTFPLSVIISVNKSWFCSYLLGINSYASNSIQENSKTVLKL